MKQIEEYMNAWQSMMAAYDKYIKNIGTEGSDENYKEYFHKNVECETLAKKVDHRILRAFIGHAIAYTDVVI